MVRPSRGASAAGASTLGVPAEVDDEFFALVYVDEELLRREFDELVAAAWSDPPPAEGRDRSGEQPADSPSLNDWWEGGRRHPRAVGGRGSRRSSRTRSPPFHSTTRPRQY